MACESVIRILDASTAILAIPAACFWFWSATVKTPADFPIYVVEPRGYRPAALGARFIGMGQSEELTALADGLCKQSSRNKWAAIFAGLSAACQAAKLFF